MDQGRFFSTDKGTGAIADLDIEIKARTQDILAQQAIFAGLGNGHLQAVDGQRILGPDIDQAVVGIDAIAADHHRLDDRIRIAFHDGPVHERTGIPFIGIAYHILVGGIELAGDLPLHTRGETGTAAAAQTGGLDIGQHVRAVA